MATIATAVATVGGAAVAGDDKGVLVMMTKLKFAFTAVTLAGTAAVVAATAQSIYVARQDAFLKTPLVIPAAESARASVPVVATLPGGIRVSLVGVSDNDNGWVSVDGVPLIRRPKLVRWRSRSDRARRTVRRSSTTRA